jgi:hypothetical protein
MVDISEKVVIKFDNSKPVEVIDFLASIHAFQKQYKKFVESEVRKYADEDIKLYIHVREGCIEWIFTTLKVKAVQDAFAFAITEPSKKLLKKTYEYFTTIIKKVESEESVENEDISSLENTQKIIQPTKNDLASKFVIKYENGTEKMEVELQGAVGRGVYDKIGEIIDKVKTNKNTICEIDKGLLQLKVHESQAGTMSIKGIIDEIDKDEKTIIFNDNSTKQQILEEDKRNPFKNVYYIVNGSIKKIDQKIIAYIITEIVEIIETDISTTEVT